MQIKALLSSLKQQITEEIRLFDRFGKLEQLVNQKIQEKDWVSVETVLETMQECSCRITAVEGQRHEDFVRIKKNLGQENHQTFRQFISSLPEKEATELEDLHKKLSLVVIRIKNQSKGMLYYLNYMQETLKELLGEIFPHRKGRLYSNQGREKRLSLEDPVIINQQL